MRTTLTEEQSLIQDSALTWLSSNYALEQRSASMYKDGGSPEVWSAFSEMGWLSLALPDDLGGLNGGPLECGLIAQALGRHLVVEPWIECALEAAQCVIAFGTADQRRRLVPAIASGNSRAILAHFESEHENVRWSLCTTLDRVDGRGVLNGKKFAVGSALGAATWFVSAELEGRLVLCVVDPHAHGVSVDAYDTSDGSRAADLHFDNVAVLEVLAEPCEDCWSVLMRILDESHLAECWYVCGVIHAASDQTRIHVQQRRQFGHPISEFQVVQHKIAEMSVHCADARAACELATMRLAALPRTPENQPVAHQLLCMAASKVLRVAREVSHQAVQLHGAMGVCEELAIAHGFRAVLSHTARLGGAAKRSLAYGDLLLKGNSFSLSTTLGRAEKV